MGCPFTNGSRGNCISREAASDWIPCFGVVSDARVLARALNSGELDVPDAIGDVGEGRECAGVEDWEASDPYDCDLDVMGTIKYCTAAESEASFASSAALGGFLYSSSGGISSGGGMGRPRAAAISWCSVHESEKSFSPLQNGASRRSIYREIVSIGSGLSKARFGSAASSPLAVAPQPC